MTRRSFFAALPGLAALGVACIKAKAEATFPSGFLVRDVSPDTHSDVRQNRRLENKRHGRNLFDLFQQMARAV
jgi:hypothetical protein